MRPDDRGVNKPRRDYAPPRLTRVALVTEEATLVACKTASVGGPGGPSWKCVGIKWDCSRQLS